MTQTEEFRIRRATADDREAVVTLVSEMFGRDVSDRYRWLYRENPHGEALTWLVVDREGIEVAVTSVFPRRVRVRGRSRVGSIGGDCYVLPRARRRGLATRLHRAALAEMRDSGVEFMYGPPLPNNLKALVRAGSVEVGVFRRYSRPLTGLAAAKAALGPRAPRVAGALATVAIRGLSFAVNTGLRHIEVDEATKLGEELDELWQRASRPAAICPERDSAFLSWRYLRPKPRTQIPLVIRRHGSVVGFCAFEARGDEAIIVDLFGLDRAACEAGIQVCVDRARQQRCSHIDFYVTPGSQDPWLLRRHGFFGRETRVFQVAVPDGEPQREVLIDPSSWYFTEGDKDMPSCFSDQPE